MKRRTSQQFLEECGISPGRAYAHAPPYKNFIWGDTSDELKLRFLTALVREKFHDKKILEIGTYRGTTTYNIAVNLSSGTIHTVDCGYEELKALIEQEAPEHTNRIDYSSYDVGEVYKSYLPNCKSIKQIIGNTTKKQTTKTLFKGSPYNLIYVDAAHTYDGIKNDTEIALECIAQSGVIIWDDYNGWWAGVNKYLDELSETLDLTYIIDNRYVIHTNTKDGRTS